MTIPFNDLNGTLFVLVSPINTFFSTTSNMSDSDLQDVHVLGKRGRNVIQEDDATVEKQAKMEEEESDDDVGPMPLLAVEVAVAKRRKRKGTFIIHPCCCRLLKCLPRKHPLYFRYCRSLVLPHERVYLEHLPNTEQYYKSFMHRDVINYCVMTKCEPNTLYRPRTRADFDSGQTS